MQDPSIYQQINPQFPEHEQLKCPRCDSANTKFCYYNNYNLSQPRHFCKNCRRYWTKGGALRNIPVGGGSRKNTKRSSSNPKRNSSSSSPSSNTITGNQNAPKSEPSAGYQLVDVDRRMMGMNGTFSSLLNGQFGNLMEGFNSNGFGKNPILNLNSDSNLIPNPVVELQSSNHSDSFLGVENGGDSSCWGSSNGWPDLAIYTPGSTFQ